MFDTLQSLVIVLHALYTPMQCLTQSTLMGGSAHAGVQCIHVCTCTLYSILFSVHLS